MTGEGIARVPVSLAPELQRRNTLDAKKPRAYNVVT